MAAYMRVYKAKLIMIIKWDSVPHYICDSKHINHYAWIF